MGDVVFDEEFCASICSIEEARRGNIAQVANEAGTEEIHKGKDVFFFASIDDALKAFVYESVVVVLAGGVLAP